MKNRVEVIIGGRIFRLLADEDYDYTKKVSSYVDGKVTDMMKKGNLSFSDALMLSAINVADELFREKEDSESLRKQLKDYIEDAAKAKSELTDLRRETARQKKSNDQNN